MQDYSVIKNWSYDTKHSFYEDLKDYFNEDKCEIICNVSKELMKSSVDVSFAEEFLLFAAEECFETVPDKIKAEVFYTLGKLYEIYKKDYSDAYTAYKQYALYNKTTDGNAIILTRLLLLKDNFTFSDELEKQLLRSYGEYDLGLRQDRLYETIANYIVAKHYSKEDEIKLYKRDILTIVKADELLFLDFIFKKDSIRDVLELPEITKSFIKSLKEENK